MFKNGWSGQIHPATTLSNAKLTIIAGPCMFESRELGFEVAQRLKALCSELGFNYVFKSSYDKANRTSGNTARGPGLERGLAWLSEVRSELSIPVLTDVHTPSQAKEAGTVVDIVQVPAFLCDQKDLLKACAETDKVVQIKKGQHAPTEQLISCADYVATCGNSKVLLCERGTSFGYNNLIVDYRNLILMNRSGYATVFDGTHAAQLPGAGGGQSSGLRDMVPGLCAAAVAVGIHALFMEVHPNPAKALSDASTQVDFTTAEQILRNIRRISN
ncbi:MAG: 3-deoxy-8-phosphooctulonate synthase [Silvanigrellaceae bacterium]